MSTPQNNTKNFAIAIGIVAGVLIFGWFCIWLFSDNPNPKNKGNIKKSKIVEEESEARSEYMAESAQWDSEKWGWYKYDNKYGPRIERKMKRRGIDW